MREGKGAMRDEATSTPSPFAGEGRGGGSDPRQRIKQTDMCVSLSAATPSPTLPRQGAGLTARRGREKRDCHPQSFFAAAPPHPDSLPPSGGEGEEGAMRNALFFPLSRHWPERVGVRVARATHPRLRGNDGREPKGEVGRGHGGVYNYPAMRPRVGRNSGLTSEAGR